MGLLSTSKRQRLIKKPFGMPKPDPKATPVVLPKLLQPRRKGKG